MVKTSPARAHSSLRATEMADNDKRPGRIACIPNKAKKFYGGCSGKLHLREKIRVQGVIREWSLLWPTGSNWTFFIRTRSGAYGEKDAQIEFFTRTLKKLHKTLN